MEHKHFKLTEYYNLVIDYFEKNKVSSEEGKIQIDRFIIKCLDNEYQTKFKEPYFLTKESFEHLKTCFFEEFKPLFTQYYKPIISTWGGSRLQEYTFSLSFNENETDMFKDPIQETKRTIDKWIDEILRPQAKRINEHDEKQAEAQGKTWSVWKSVYIEFLLNETEKTYEIHRRPCTGFCLTENIIQQLVGTNIGEFRITECKIREEAVTVIKIAHVNTFDQVKEILQEKVKEVAKKLDIDKFEQEDLINVRFTWQTEGGFDGYWLLQIPRKFWEEKRVPFAMALSDMNIPGYIMDTVEERNEKEMGYGTSDVNFIFVHLRKKLDGGETQ